MMAMVIGRITVRCPGALQIFELAAPCHLVAVGSFISRSKRLGVGDEAALVAPADVGAHGDLALVLAAR